MTAYRPYSTQEYNYNGKASQISWPDYPDAEDYAEAAKLVAPPGTSDHQTGLAVDITDKYYSQMDASKMDQDFLAWLKDNCAEYGFILRYPTLQGLHNRLGRALALPLCRQGGRGVHHGQQPLPGAVHLALRVSREQNIPPEA